MDESTSEQAVTEHIYQIVRLNLDAAEENSAASEELSAQSDLIGGIIHKFRTK